MLRSFLFVFSFFLFISFVFAREGSDTFTVNGNDFIYIARFGFYNGGYANLNISMSTPNYYGLLYSCTEYAWRELYVDHLTDDFCSNETIPINGCFMTNFTTIGNLSFTVSTGKFAEMYYFGLLSCSSLTTSSKMDYMFLNPGGQQLSSEYVPLPTIYLIFSFLWIPITMLWIYNWIKHRHQKSKLHRTITIYPISKLIWVISGSIFWYLASINATFELKMIIIYGALRLICLSFLVCVFILISRGWGIIDDNLKKNDKLIALGFIILFFFSSILGVYFGGIFQFTMILLYAFLVFFLFTFTNQSIERLENLRNDPESNIVGVNLRGVDVILQKKEMLRRFNKLMVLFCIFQICISLSDTVFLYNVIWIGQLAYEVTDYIMFICIGWVFRLRDNNVYFHLIGAGGSGEKSPLLQPEIIINNNSTVIEPENEEDSTNPYDYHDIGPGMAGL